MNNGGNMDPNEYKTLMDAYQTSLDLWRNKDPKTTQIDWNGMYQANMGQQPVTYNGIAGKKHSIIL